MAELIYRESVILIFRSLADTVYIQNDRWIADRIEIFAMSTHDVPPTAFVPFTTIDHSNCVDVFILMSPSVDL